MIWPLFADQSCLLKRYRVYSLLAIDLIVSKTSVKLHH